MLPGSLIPFYVGAQSVPEDITVDVLIVAGGGSSGVTVPDTDSTRVSGGGGAGGRLLQTGITAEGGVSYTVAIGGGGFPDNTGNASSAFSFSATGGGPQTGPHLRPRRLRQNHIGQ